MVTLALVLNVSACGTELDTSKSRNSADELSLGKEYHTTTPQYSRVSRATPVLISTSVYDPGAGDMRF